MTSEHFNRKIITQDGREYYGYAFGDTNDRICEAVFNTSMVGYQEIISDPSYTYQAVIMTFPLIGNYGMAEDDYESLVPSAGALIVREYIDKPSNFRSTASLGEVMKKYGIPGIYGVDTRALARSVRDTGSQKILITNVGTSLGDGVALLNANEIPRNAVSTVSRKAVETYAVENRRFHVAAIDCGMKQNIVRELNARGCTVTVVPWNTPAEKIDAIKPDGVFISNGPGDPKDVPETTAAVKALIGKYPMFGICLGHQIISLAYGAETYKLKFGHHGSNHPVRNFETDKVEITSQNHSYAVSPDSIKNTPLAVTHINLLDNTVEGIQCERDCVAGIQYHPESAPGPQDSGYLFDRFTAMMEKGV